MDKQVMLENIRRTPNTGPRGTQKIKNILKSIVSNDDGGGDNNAVLYTEQTLSESQKQQARMNIGSDESTIELLCFIFGEDYIRTEIAKKQYLTFEAVNVNTDVTFTATDEGDALTISVSTDGGTTWTNKQTSTSGTVLATLGAGEKLLVKGTNSCYGPSNSNSFSASNSVYVYGNVMSLIAGDNFESVTSLNEDYALYGLFSQRNSPNANLIFDANHILVLPATTLSTACYSEMFKGCTGLTSAPALPAITLAESCYAEMFNGCTSLTSAPNLPVTTLANSCYQQMFQDCTGLISAPTLPATTLKLQCYSGMFQGCTSFTSAPALPAITLVAGCYENMFKDCSSLNYIKAMFTTTPTTLYTSNWVNGVAATGTFVKNASADWNVTGVNGVPSGWTIQTEDA